MTNHEHLLGNLLAIIHGDGGHYITDHGWEKAVEDAITKVYEDRAKAEPPLKTAGPWVWAEDVASRKGGGEVIAEIEKPLDIEWSGWVLLNGVKRILRGGSVRDVMERIDAILETDGWVLRASDPPPPKEPVKADRVVAALMKDPKLAMEVRELLSAQFEDRSVQ